MYLIGSLSLVLNEIPKSRIDCSQTLYRHKECKPLHEMDETKTNKVIKASTVTDPTFPTVRLALWFALPT